MGDGSTLDTGAVEQAASVPTINAIDIRRRRLGFMGLILLEALLALIVLVAIVWWTMFSGRKRGELPEAEPPAQDPRARALPPQDQQSGPR